MSFNDCIGYGLTETSPNTHILPEVDGISKVGSIGLLLPNLEARLLVDGDGNGDIEAGEGEPGELWLRGPNIMKVCFSFPHNPSSIVDDWASQGYLGNIKATQESITLDGWFKTGDIATRDPEGYYYIVDRRKELIKYKV